MTFLVMGPDVSKVFEIGIIPDRLTNPMVGFNPTIELAEDGDKIEPEVSEPIETVEKLAEIAAPLPELEPPESNFFFRRDLKFVPQVHYNQMDSYYKNNRPIHLSLFSQVLTLRFPLTY